MRFLLLRRPGFRPLPAGWRAWVGQRAPGTTGVSHFLEHMLFKGTRAIAAPGELWRTYTAAGARGLNALTLSDMTLYFVTLPAEKAELWFWLESDRLANLAFRDFDTERGVIAENGASDQSTPTGARAADGDFWGAHPTVARHRPPADLAALTRQDAALLAAWYGPGNLTAALVGDFDPDVAALAERYWAPAGGRHRRRCARRRSQRPRDGGDLLPAAGGGDLPTAPFGHADTAALEVLAGILDGRTGRLHRGRCSPAASPPRPTCSSRRSWAEPSPSAPRPRAAHAGRPPRRLGGRAERCGASR
jgi:hypothetical protein